MKRPFKRATVFLLRQFTGKKKHPLEVRDEQGKLVFKGAGRRRYREQVFFDSELGQRVFSLPANKIRRARKKELEKLKKPRLLFGKLVFVDKRSAKQTKRHV